MRTKILAVTILCIGLFIACKKVGEIVNPENVEVAAISKRVKPIGIIENEQIRVNNAIMNFDAVSLKERQILIDGLVMENGHIKGIKNGGTIMSKLSDKQVIKFYRLLLPDAKLEVYNRNSKKYLIDDFANQTSRSIMPNNNLVKKSCYRSEYPADILICADCGNDQCFIYTGC